jgi:hypothetical protein
MEVELDFGPSIGFTNKLALWQVPDNHLLSEKSLVNPTATGNFELYFEYDDIPGLIALLEKEKVQFAHKLHTESWGQYTIRFFDPDGHLIEVGEPLSALVKRLKVEGLDTNAIVQKTSIAEEEVIRLLGI